MIRNGVLQYFILDFGLKHTDGRLGRSTKLEPLRLSLQEKCGDCTTDELLDALYTLRSDHADLFKAVPISNARWQPVKFDRVRNTPRWKDFFYDGDFRIAVTPAGRAHYQTLLDELQRELAPVTPPTPRKQPIGFGS